MFVLIALGLGASIGYDISPGRISTVTETPTTSITTTQTVATSVIVISGQTYPVLTITKQTVYVVYYEPTCVTISGRTSVTYENQPFGQSTTFTYIFPSNMPNSSVVSLTTTTNRTLTVLNRTVSESISC